MSFSLPQHVPDFSDRDNRQYDSWTHVNRRDSAFLYKDKPYYGGVYPPRRKKWYTSKWLLGTLVVLGVVFMLNLMRGHRHGEPDYDEWFKYREDDTGDWTARRERVKDVFMYSWNGYVEHAWGKDEYKPISGIGRNMIPEGMFSCNL